jgi:hypothetical protein
MRCAGLLGVAVLALSACGGLEGSVTGEMPQGISRTHVTGDGNPQKLLYVADYYTGDMDVYSYPHGVRVDKIACCVSPQGLCVGNAGAVWVVDTADRELLEFRHGGTKPERKLKDPLIWPFACSVDPKTGDIALSNNLDNGGGDVLVFRKAEGDPIHIEAPRGYSPYFVAYDGSGELFIDGIDLAYNFQLLKVNPGQRKAVVVTFNGNFSPFSPAGLKWDGTDLAVGNAYGENGNEIYRLAVAGNKATLKSTATLLMYGQLVDFSIAQNEVVASVLLGSYSGSVKFWPYPKGGRPLKTLKGPFYEPFGVALSN